MDRHVCFEFPQNSNLNWNSTTAKGYTFNLSNYFLLKYSIYKTEGAKLKDTSWFVTEMRGKIFNICCFANGLLLLVIFIEIPVTADQSAVLPRALRLFGTADCQ